MNLIVLSIPLFLLLIAGELLLARRFERDYYRLSDALNDLSCGILQQLADAFLRATLFAGYVLLYERLRVGTLASASWAAWVACFVGVDFLYYWAHRLSHEVNLMWASHVVHHQSEDFNLAVALRQSSFQGVVTSVFYWPLALAGFPPLMFLTCVALNTLYQFWIHTRAIGRLGPFEWVLNTPSHHRVHHGRNPKYIDRNHAGTLIVWDRLFGTFQEEQEEPVYGITKPLASWNPVWANLHYWVELFRMARRTRRWSDRLRVFWKPPGWRPADLGGHERAPDVDAASYRKWNVPLLPGLASYTFVQFLIVLFGSALFLFRQASIPPAPKAAIALAIVLSLLALGSLLERRPWSPRLEALRLALLPALAWLAPGDDRLLILAAVALALVSGWWLARARPAPAHADANATTTRGYS